jgi:hypothetical protein
MCAGELCLCGRELHVGELHHDCGELGSLRPAEMSMGSRGEHGMNAGGLRHCRLPRSPWVERALRFSVFFVEIAVTSGYKEHLG